MRLENVHVDDIVLCNVRGRQFLASVRLRLPDGRLAVEPLNPNVTYTRVTARQVVGHWRKTKTTSLPPAGAGEGSLTEALS